MPTLFKRLGSSCWNNNLLKKNAIFKRNYYCEVKEKPELHPWRLHCYPNLGTRSRILLDDITLQHDHHTDQFVSVFIFYIGYLIVPKWKNWVSFIEPHLSVTCLHKMIESKRPAFFDGVKYISDPLQEEIPLNQLLSKEYAASRRNSIQSDMCVWNQFAIICFYQLTPLWFMRNILYTLTAIRK